MCGWPYTTGLQVDGPRTTSARGPVVFNPRGDSEDAGGHHSTRVARGHTKSAGTDPRGKSVKARSVEEHAVDTFGTVEKARHWFNRPNPIFGGKTPQQVLQADPSRVEAELVRIDYGVYV